MHITRKQLIYIALTLIVLIGCWLRMNGIFANSFAYTFDVGRDLLEVRKIVIHHDLVLIGQTTGLAGLFYGPWWYYFLTIPFILFGGNPQGVAFFIALLGIAAVILGFLLGRKIHGDRLGLLIAGLLSFSPYTIGLTSQIWNPNIAPFFVIVVLLLLWPVLVEKKISRFSAVTIGLLTGFLLDSEIVFGLLFAAGIVVSIFFLLKKAVLQKNSLFFLLGFFLTLTPRILFEFRHDLLMTRNFFRTSGTEDGATFALPAFSTLYERLVFFFDMFDRTFFDKNLVLSAILLILIFASLIVNLKNFPRYEKAYTKLIAGISLTFFVALSFFSHNIFNHYAVGLPILFIILVSILLLRGIQAFLSKTIQYGLLIAFLVIIINPFTIIKSLQNPHWEGDAAVYRNQLAVIDYIYAHADKKPFNYIAYTPAVYDYTYQYLFLWHGQKSYSYTPDIKKQTLFFVILEPDHEYPWRLTQWLEKREGDGKIIEEREVKGGIKVQTRLH